MLAFAFISWWYGAGWIDNIRRTQDRISFTYHEFSVPILLRTLFSPWRRIISYGGGSLGMRLRAVVDNIVSRFVGLTVRLLALIAALVLMALAAVLGIVTMLAWPLLPLAGPALLVWGLAT